MNKIKLLFLLGLLLVPLLAKADRGITPFTTLDNYIDFGKSIFIGQCLPITETNSSSRMMQGVLYERSLKVIKTLKGSDKVDDVIKDLTGVPLVPGHYYLICDGGISSFWIEQGEIEIRLQAGEDKKLNDYFLKGKLDELEGKTIKEQLLIIFKHRKADLESDEQKTKREMDIVNKALNSN